MDNTLDDILSDLRQLLPASLRGAYLDGYVRRRRTPMELLLSRSWPKSLPNVKVSASTFDDVRSEIRSLGLHPTDEIPFLQEIEQALAFGKDTRPAVARAVALRDAGARAVLRDGPETPLHGQDRQPVFRTGTVLTARSDFALVGASGHKIKAKAGQVFWVTSSETLQRAEGGVRVDRKGRGSANGGLLFKPADIDKFFVVDNLGARPTAAPQVAASGRLTHEARAATIVPATADAPAYTVHRPHLWASDSSASKIRLGDAVRNCLADAPASAEAVMRRRVEHIDADLRQRGLKLDYPDQVVAYVVEDTEQRMAMRGREACAACGTDMGESDCQRCSAQERALEVATSAPLGIRHLGPDASKDELSRARFAGHDGDGPTPMDRSDMDSRYPLGAVTAGPVFPLGTYLTARADFTFTGAAGRKIKARAGQIFWVTSSETLQKSEGGVRVDRKGKGSASNGHLFKPADVERFFIVEDRRAIIGKKSTSAAATPASDVAKERHWRESTYRAEADVIADTFNEGAVWQAEAISRRGTAQGDAVRLSIYPEQRGPEHVVAVATVHDGEVEIDWRDLGLTMAARNEISRRLRSAAATESADAPSPLRDLIESTEKRALELGAKPARTRSIGRVTSDNPEERRLGEAVRDLRDRSDFDEAVTWLDSAELNIPFDIGERTSELDAVDKIMSEMWASILDTSTIALGGVRGEGRGSERVFYVSPEMIFDAGSMPFLLHRAMDNPSGSTYGPATLKEVAVKIIDPGDDDTYSAKVIDRDKVLKNDSMVHANERGAHFIRSLYRNMKLLRDDLERAPKALDDVRKLLYWTGAMLDTPRCQDATHSRALEAFEAAKVAYDQARQHVVTHGTTSSELASIKAPLRKAAVSAANLATECGEGQVDIFSSPRPPAASRLPAFAPPGFGLDPGTTWPTIEVPDSDSSR